MVKRVTGTNIDKYWSKIKHIVLKCLPPVACTDDMCDRVHKALLSGAMQCWIIYADKEMAGVSITAPIHDEYTGVKALVIYALYTTEHMSRGLYAGFLNSLRNFAHANNCYDVVSIRRMEG